ncbi:M23 family metallopeptidase [Patescibacteria group bacterium]
MRGIVLFRILLIGFMVAVFLPSAQAEYMFSTGFHYPVKNYDENSNPIFTGRWLAQPDEYFDNVYHIGVDIKAEQKNPSDPYDKDDEIYAVADGIVKSPSVNGWTDGDTVNIGVIIEHRLSDGRFFYAIYGHANKKDAVATGAKVKAGDKIGVVGDWKGTGDHLHFGILSPGLKVPVGTSSYGKAPLSDYGEKDDGYVDNGLIDPIWFMAHHVPDNWISRGGISQNNPITMDNPWYSELCIKTLDPTCGDLTYYEMCVLENSPLCLPFDVSAYSAIDGGGEGSGSQGGDFTQPNFVVTDVKLKTLSGEEKYVWDKSEEMYIHAWIDNIGDADWDDGIHDSIEVRYYLSQGRKEDLHSEWERVGIDDIQKYNLEMDDNPKHEEDRLILLNKESIEPGNYYNIVVCADRIADQNNGIGNVDEIHESDNCFAEKVFYVSRPEGPATDDGVMSIINLILFD